jgi:hypothetical protein
MLVYDQITPTFTEDTWPSRRRILKNKFQHLGSAGHSANAGSRVVEGMENIRTILAWKTTCSRAAGGKKQTYRSDLLLAAFSG